MKTKPFIIKEGTATANDRIVLLWRLIKTMKLFNRLLPLSLLFLVLGLIVPQIYLWIIGQLSSCSALPCSVSMPSQLVATFGLKELNVTLLFLGALLAINIGIQIVSQFIFDLSAQWSVLGLHDKMIEKISRVRTTFFDEHPSGRIINRLVRDFDVLTQQVTVRFSDTLYFSLSILISVVLAWIVQPLILLLTFPVLFLVIYIQWHIALMNERVIAERSAALSTVLHRETDVIEGGRIFALYAALPALIQRLCKAADRYVHFHLWQINLERYGRSLTGILRVLFTGAVLLVSVYGLKTGSISEAFAVVLLSQLPPLQNKFGGLAWSWLNTVQSFATVRRIFEYVDLEIEENSEKPSLPDLQTIRQTSKDLSGDIVFSDYAMSYRPQLPKILDGLTMKIPSGKRVALVGRTGSGKTSLVQALFRMVYVHSGDISIGGESIFSRPITTLRENFVVVPQEPYLFAGTLRSNLDYKNIRTDVELNESLSRVGIEISLDTVLIEGGENLSLGERQLLCLARALLAKAPYVIMDEPTSSVDSITDYKMQRVIREEFVGRTIITIAHRLDTIRDYDWVIELEQGKVIFEGTPNTFFEGKEAHS